MTNTAELRRLSPRTTIGRLLWTLAGALAIVLTLCWVLWYGPEPLLGPDRVTLPVTYWLSPPTYAGALAAWGCFSRASRMWRSAFRSSSTDNQPNHWPKEAPDD